MRELNTNNYNHNQILRILLRNKEKSENLKFMGDIVSNEMYNFITYLIEIHRTSGNIKNHIEMKIQYCDSILNEIIEAKNEYIHSNALNDITTRHDSIYNTDFDDSENQGRRRLAREDPYIKLITSCKLLLKELNIDQYDNIRKTLLNNKNKYQH